MGPISRAMLAKLVDDNPTGESGFREFNISVAAIANGWVKYVAQSGRVRFYSITDTGREALALWRRHNPGRA